MVVIKKTEPPKVDLYDPEGNHLGLLNEYEFLDARVQIRKGQLWGYYVIFGGKRIKIDRNGTMEDYPRGLFDQLGDLYLQLI